jgi:hypothetical protein
MNARAVGTQSLVSTVNNIYIKKKCIKQNKYMDLLFCIKETFYKKIRAVRNVMSGDTGIMCRSSLIKYKSSQMN